MTTTTTADSDVVEPTSIVGAKVAAILEAMSQSETTRTPDALVELRAGKYPLYKRVLESADAQEGIAAFNEKRTPRWQGK